MPDITAAEIEQALDGMQVTVKNWRQLDTNTDLAAGTVANPHGLAAELKREIDSYPAAGRWVTFDITDPAASFALVQALEEFAARERGAAEDEGGNASRERWAAAADQMRAQAEAAG